MTDHSKGVSDLIWLGNRLSGLTALLPDLIKFNDLGKAVEAIEADLKAKRDELEALLGKHTEAQTALAGVQVALANSNEEATKQAQAIVTQAQAAADQTLTEAKQKASALLTEKQAELDALDAKVSAATAAHTETLAQVAAAKAEHDRIQSEIAALKARLN